MKNGVVVRIVQQRHRAVVFSLDGRRIARDRTPPYRVLVRGLRPARHGAKGRRYGLVVRDSRTGRPLARISLVRRLRTDAFRVAPPAPPRAYQLPAGAVYVSSSAGLLSALAAPNATDIVLADGVYDNPTYFQNPDGHRLWAARLGGAVLTAGISFGSRWGSGGGLVRGIAFDVQDPAKVLQGSIVHVWGNGRGTRVLDVTLEGHSVIPAGVIAREPEEFVAQRVVARHFTDYGVAVDANVKGAVVAAPALLEDLDLANVSRSKPRASGGTAEACLWVGNTAVVRRVRTRNCAWEGLWTGTAASGARFEDVDIDRSGVGVYMEHFTHGSTFERLRVGPTVDVGVNCEWADPAWGSLPACVDNVVQDSYFDTRIAGVWLDLGTTRTTVRRSIFVNQQWAAIGDYKGIDNLGDTRGNDYSWIAPQAVPVSHRHLYTSGLG